MYRWKKSIFSAKKSIYQKKNVDCNFFEKYGTSLDFIVGLLLLTNDGITLPLHIGPFNYAIIGLIFSFQLCSPSNGKVHQDNVDDRHGGPTPARSTISTWDFHNYAISILDNSVGLSLSFVSLFFFVNNNDRRGD